ncbi:FAD-dependent monooxygenase [Pseudonocardia phyllosphaerae]|uniref:FAD-dependent monooxygenase n=1 Tax=Pseudonocardia phyllosphaerae TaxID=3390502 RepID=UPI00397E003D
MTATEGPRVLVSGAGVAGSTLAYWLRRFGFRPTVVERAPGLRSGGQAVDFRGSAMTVLDRMGLLDELREHDTEAGDCTIVDDDGAPVAVMPAVLFAGELEVPVDELIATLHRAAADAGAEYRFGDHVTALAEHDDAGGGVDVTFAGGATERFDLVVGADGAHSGVRALVFGPERDFADDLGVRFGYFGTGDYLGLGREGRAMSDGEGAASMVVGVGDGPDGEPALRVGLMYRGDVPAVDARVGTDEAKRLLAEHTAVLGWETPELLKRLADADDLYFDAMTRIRMDTWSRGRVVLLGDAACCASPASGRGTSQALLGAYVLAGELALAAGDHASAFAAYEQLLRPLAEENQELGAMYCQYLFAQPEQERIDAMAAQAEEPGEDQDVVPKDYPSMLG